MQHSHRLFLPTPSYPPLSLSSARPHGQLCGSGTKVSWKEGCEKKISFCTQYIGNYCVNIIDISAGDNKGGGSCEKERIKSKKKTNFCCCRIWHSVGGVLTPPFPPWKIFKIFISPFLKPIPPPLLLSKSIYHLNE